MKSVKKNKVFRIFERYSKSKTHLTKREMVVLLKKEYKLQYSHEVINSLMHIWGHPRGSTRVIPKDTFSKMYQKPYGFLRDHR